MTPDKFNEALDAAVRQSFIQLFQVLFVDPSPKGIMRFEDGLKKLGNTEQAVANIIRQME